VVGGDIQQFWWKETREHGAIEARTSLGRIGFESGISAC